MRAEIPICKWCKNPDGLHDNCEDAYLYGHKIMSLVGKQAIEDAFKMGQADMRKKAKLTVPFTEFSMSDYNSGTKKGFESGLRRAAEIARQLGYYAAAGKIEVEIKEEENE